MMVGWMVGWMDGFMNGLFLGWLVGLLDRWLVGWLVVHGKMVGWIIYRIVCIVGTGRLVDQFLDDKLFVW